MSNYDSAYRLNEVPSENDLRHILERASEGDDLESAVESELENRESSTTYRPSGGGAKGGAIAGATFGYFASQAVPNPFYQLGLIGSRLLQELSLETNSSTKF